MEVVRAQLGSDNLVARDCARCVFRCDGAVMQKKLAVRARLTGPGWRLGFAGAAAEVYVPSVSIDASGEFVSIVKNYWCSGEPGGTGREGHYSLLEHIERLYIYDNPRALQDFIDYMDGAFQLEGPWAKQRPDKRMLVIVECSEEDVTSIERLRECFVNVVIKRLRTDLRVDNSIGYDCDCFKFTGCRGVVPRTLVVGAKLNKSLHFLLDFDDADGEVRIPQVVISEGGQLKSLIYNRWGRGNDNGEMNCYSLLPHVEKLSIKDNQQALFDLVSYIAGTHEINDSNWRIEPLDSLIKIIIENPKGSYFSIAGITDHFAEVTVDNKRAGEYLAQYIGIFNHCFD